MKKLFTLLLALVATSALWAEDFSVGGIYYKILNGSEVEVTYGSSEYSGSVAIPSTVTRNGTTYSVTNIGYRAFHECSSLTSVTIPNSVTSIGRSAFAYCSSLTSVTIPNSVTTVGGGMFHGCSKLKSVVLSNNITSLPSYYDQYELTYYGFFYNCSSLTSITIPNSVTSIGSYAFYECSSLTSVTIPDSVTSIGYAAFAYCSSLTSVTIPNSVTSIEDYAFRDCSSLTSVTIPNSVTSIGWYAFSYCSSLTKTNYTGDIAGWCAIKFGNSYANPMCCSHNFFINDQEIKDLVIPNSVTSIGDAAFYGCSSLTSVTIPNSVTSIGGYTFYGCSSLTSVTIGNSVTSIGGYAFYDCSSLTSVTIPNSVTSIEGYTFYGCSSLTSVTIPNSVTYIGDHAFRGCSSLTSIIIPENITNIGTGVFVSCASLTSVVWNAKNCVDFFTGSDAEIGTFSTLFFENSRIPSDNGPIVSITVCPITSVVFGDEVESIPAYLCCGLRRLTSITIPNSVTSIGNYAFSWCSSLTSVTIGNSVTSIGKDAFRDCSALTSITIPNSVTSIGGLAFYYCSSLDTLTCLAMTPPALGGDVFDGCDNPTLFVPCAALSDYQLHEQWGQFTTIECISSEEADTEDVIIESGTTTVIITWPTEKGADTYTIVIKKDGEVVCTLTFNADGQLLNIAFAPGREGNRPAQYAEQANNGYRFTVTGLEEATDYTYDITVKDASNKTIKSHSGKFTTESLTAVENTHIQSPISNCQKILRDGQLIIIRDGVEYNAMGQEL